MTTRLFVAANIPEESLNEVISIRNKIYDDLIPVKWESIEKLHVTLMFLGDVENDRIDKIINVLDEITKNLSVINSKFLDFDLLFKQKRPHILWLGLEANEEFLKLHVQIQNALEKLRFLKETRKFKPHITLLRLRGKENLNKIKKFRNYQLPQISFKIESISLFKSELLQSGSKYTQLKNFKLI